MTFNLVTYKTDEAKKIAHEKAEEFGIKIVDTRRSSVVENIWGQLEDIFVFKCKGSFEDLIRMKYATDSKFKIWNGISLIC